MGDDDMATRELYEVMGLAPFTDGAMVDQAYWHLARTYQTLALADPRARESLDELNDAYAVLGTPRLRDEYDATLAGTHPAPVQAKSKRWSLSALRLPFSKHSTEEGSELDRVATHSQRPVAAAEPLRARPRKSQVQLTDVKDLRASTERMLERWRTNANIQTRAADAADGAPPPDSTLVDIFRTERNLKDHGDPLAAVMEILKAPAEVISAGADANRS